MNQNNTMNISQITGFLGSIILIISVFTPIVSVPIIGSINYFQNGKGDGVIVLVLAVISFLFVFFNNYKGLWFTAGSSLAVMMFTIYNFYFKIAQAKINMKMELGNNPFSDFADIALQSVQLEWGWAFLIVGVIFLLFSAGANAKGEYFMMTKNKSHHKPVKYSTQAVSSFVLLEGTRSSIPIIKLINNEIIIVGRSSSADIKIDNKYVSSKHLALKLDNNGSVKVRDMVSSNGTYIDGCKLESNIFYELKIGEKLIIGSEDVVYIIKELNARRST